MAVHNGARYLPSTLASLAALKTPPGGVQYVLVDDGSTDESADLLETFVREQNGLDERSAVCIRRSASGGLSSALNLGLEHCSAELIARADADDLYVPDRLLTQFAAMQARPELAALSCGFRKIDQNDQPLKLRTPEQGPDWLAFQMMFMNSLLHPGVMFRKSVILAVGAYDPAYWTAQDSDLWARLVSAGYSVDNIPDCLVDYRVHVSSVTGSRGAKGRQLSLTVPGRLQEAYLGKLPPGHDIQSTVDLYQGFCRMEPAQLAAGLDGLRRIESHAVERETAAILARFRARISRTSLMHARWMRRRAPLLALKLYVQARRWRAGSRRLSSCEGGTRSVRS
ncbi:glycosyltransferase [Allohahella marinimesophila]|uniref:Glycosyltransferase 2-like domain-containing protein n=1 Tax=Allohahella marinimesophila TaxID=1054972 RepID=A0ABP7PZW8_9GAMM